MKKLIPGIIGGGIASVSYAAKVFAVTISNTVPGASTDSTLGPGGVIKSLYQFTLMIAGIIALGAIVYGGVKYAAAAGNASSQSDAKQWIWSALIGLLLLAGVYIILNTVNPALTNLQLPTLSPISISAPASQSAQGAYTCGGAVNGTCPAGLSCTMGSGSFSCIGTTATCHDTTRGTCQPGFTCTLITPESFGCVPQ